MRLSKINSNCKNPELLIILTDYGDNDDFTGIFQNYLNKFGKYKDRIRIAYVPVPEKGRLNRKAFTQEADEITDFCQTQGISKVMVGIPEYMRNFLGITKTYDFERAIGTATTKDGLVFIPTINYFMLKFAPQKVKLLQRSINCCIDVLEGTYKDDTKAVQDAIRITVPKTIEEAKDALSRLINKGVLTIDIETTGLTWTTDRLLTVSFSPNEEESTVISFKRFNNDKIFTLLKNFFIKYQGRSVYHNAVFDVPFLVYKLFMKDLDDRKGAIYGINQMNLDDSIVMAYLCLNSTERPELGLKLLAFPKFGDYDSDINQAYLDEMPLEKVEKYNAIDTAATFYVFNKYNALLEQEEQLELYETYYRLAIPTMIKLKMVGLVLDEQAVTEAFDNLDALVQEVTEELQSFPQVQEVIQYLKEEKAAKTKTKKPEDYPDTCFNPASSLQKQKLLFDVMNLPVIKDTKAGAPSTDKEVLSELVSAVSDDAQRIVELLQDFAQTAVVRTTFLKAFAERAVTTPSGLRKLYGDYKLYGTASGRLSSYNINLQNLPATGSKYAKLVKSLIIAPEGWKVLGADMDSLEDKVMANLANCENKLKEFTDGFDGHCLRCAYFFPDELKERGIDIDITDPESVNSIKKLAPDLRQDSKPVSFAKQYGSGIGPIMTALKCSESKAKQLSNTYDEMYKELKQFASETHEQCISQGYTQGFFGLKLRTPNVLAEDSSVSSKVNRTATNMRIQSSAMLTVKAVALLQKDIEDAGLEADILINATIHDSIYCMYRDDPKVLEFINKQLVKHMSMDYEGQIVPNSAKCEVGTSWADMVEIPNHSDDLDYSKLPDIEEVT